MVKVPFPDLWASQESVCCLKMISAAKHVTYEHAHHLAYYTRTNRMVLTRAMLSRKYSWYTQEEEDGSLTALM